MFVHQVFIQQRGFIIFIIIYKVHNVIVGELFTKILLIV
ncbi:hypothetical protein Catovirus_1_118 [Catovirus CTV1]|uniref:Uncharacterized protein n=1 Tax=Catovirus CTV1 TaxID=1977631 RepID=A0A1V0S8V3_9VIRU|nr:hypothetical protein Catovirus_1_118 [Catovirus CTV1]